MGKINKENNIMQNALQFKVSSALKNIIGSDLISDDFIAIFELVKNAYDAHATIVEVSFIDVYSDNSKIIIKDNGKGMNYDDLINKWLFVAYSAKKEGTEEESYSYRDKIKVKRTYAGAKGIGRFSCDRLGHELYLETIKDEPNSKIETLLTEWDKFEGDIKDEFVNISVLHETKSTSNYNNQIGTILEISNLKSEWNRDKILKLKDALAKLINPNTQNKNDEFTIIINAIEELENDKVESDKRKIVNGKVENLIFETLDLKTTKIVSKVGSKDSQTIETTLYEGGKLVYSIIERNPLLHLFNVEYVIYFLNRSAKYTFSRRMGVSLIEYGHVFMYKNGLRVYPYGERGEDPFKMDTRKAQGYNRYLGTREVIGFIAIEEPNDDLRETSSRGDGLIKTNAYVGLVEWFYTTLKRLEKYGIDIIAWGNDLANDDFIRLDSNEKQRAIKELIENLTKSENIESYKVSPEIFKILEGKQEKSAKTTLADITKKLDSGEFNKEEILKSIKSVEYKIDKLKEIKDEAENEAFEKLIENEELSEELDREIANNLFAQSIVGTETEELISLQHQIVHTAGNVSFFLNELINSINNNKPKNEIIESINDISFEVQRIVSASRYVTKAGFNKDAEKITSDIVQFINEYIENIYIPTKSFIHQERPIDISIKKLQSLKKELKFRPFEFTVTLDNLFTNSRKAKSTKIDLIWSRDSKNLILSFKDNGVGIPTELSDKIFDFGFSQTNGSGIGLFTVKKILSKYNSSIEVNTKVNPGVEFIIKIPL
ncbi:MAG: ATP-binding protein [Bacteroidales bacterium]|nr:ATP-binding protein [Bacteroidales bacterium]